MAGITLEQAQAKLNLWLEAEEKIASAQEYSISSGNQSRRLVRADLPEVRRNIDYWNGKVIQLSRGSSGIRIRGGTPT